jgi:hypothetical protein
VQPATPLVITLARTESVNGGTVFDGLFNGRGEDDIAFGNKGRDGAIARTTSGSTGSVQIIECV